MELKRVINRIKSCDIQDCMLDAIKAFYTDSITITASNIPDWQQLPSKFYITCLAARIAEFIKLLVHGIHTCNKVYQSWRTQLVVGFFMQTALVIMGSVSRLKIYFVTWHKELLGLYQVLLDWIPQISKNAGDEENEKSLRLELPDPKDLKPSRWSLEPLGDVSYINCTASNKDDKTKCIEKKQGITKDQNKHGSSNAENIPIAENKDKGTNSQSNKPLSMSIFDDEDLGEPM
ncbi:hypothetical protein H4219_005541 [Mycoemilia scoparia]|uniref:Nucleolus and neural progenitor protein-like N-terminal domain-containing protein n=1 Tax=Mycoemilia scoparia TaxID=417184 RepID=A0A9W7ZVP3_9FUNG|nr:hypothetical protein H4219_005541 [Mycoemilia scoparia]